MTKPQYGVVPHRVPAGTPARKAVVLSADKFEDLELYVPVFRLVESGWIVDIAAPKTGKITGESGFYYVIANRAIDEVDPDDYDLLIVPGGTPDGDGVPQEIKEAGGEWIDQDVVVDGNLVTSRWPMDLSAFTRELIKLVANH